MRAILTVIAGIVVSGCGSSSGPCKALDGTYRVSFELLDGTCGEVPTQLMSFGGAAAQAEVDAACTLSRSRSSEDGCTNEAAFTCGANKFVARMVLDSSGESAEAEMTMTGPSCTGTYAVTYERP